MSENIGFFTQSLPIKAVLVTVCVESKFILERLNVLRVLFFYYEQVSIAGQPGGVEAARVKIRVSFDCRDLNLTRRDGQAKKTQRLAGLWLCVYGFCRTSF